MNILNTIVEYWHSPWVQVNATAEKISEMDVEVVAKKCLAAAKMREGSLYVHLDHVQQAFSFWRVLKEGDLNAPKEIILAIALLVLNLKSKVEYTWQTATTNSALTCVGMLNEREVDVKFFKYANFKSLVKGNFNLFHCHHPHIREVIGHGIDDKEWEAIVYERAISLFDLFLHKPGQFEINFALKIIKSICGGLEEISKFEMPSFHIHTTDVFINIMNKCVKLANPGEITYQVRNGDFFKSEDLENLQRLENVRYLPPEAYDPNVEVKDSGRVYMLGVLLHRMLSGENPYAKLTIEQLYYNNVNNSLKRLPSLKDCPASVVAIVNACLQFEPSRRPTLEQLQRDLDDCLSEEIFCSII